MPSPAEEFHRQLMQALLHTEHQAPFQAQLAPRQVAGIAYSLLDNGIDALGIPRHSLLVVNAFSTEEAALSHHQRTINLMGMHKGSPPVMPQNLEFVGLVRSSRVSGFTRETASASIMIWPNLGQDPLTTYELCRSLSQHVTRLNRARSQQFQGRGIALIWLLEQNRPVLLQTWRTEQEATSATKELILPAVHDAFAEYGVEESNPQVVKIQPISVALKPARGPA